MGNKLFDQYTFLHFSVGAILYYWNISFVNLIILHTIFEFVENTQVGIDFINKYFVFWPGGKPKKDSFINIIGDTIGALSGWLAAYGLDKLGNKYGWYDLHIES